MEKKERTYRTKELLIEMADTSLKEVFYKLAKNQEIALNNFRTNLSSLFIQGDCIRDQIVGLDLMDFGNNLNAIISDEPLEYTTPLRIEFQLHLGELFDFPDNKDYIIYEFEIAFNEYDYNIALDYFNDELKEGNNREISKRFMYDEANQDSILALVDKYTDSVQKHINYLKEQSKVTKL
ncbi:hypothetical protein [Acidiluteibacter ferrifornacis]|uniref:Uncharacterized protein n=1 Tax=Acidiluteibacter ferrifornacis TaxID=2692424 RepID=A0A6N9NKW2_9FLAO|nr:hypothetical protein [Acidiluteibacter ferrifornacis]NBG67326.1 hypothetical protein [Acidiluteibacter ferrifornacis]